MRAWALAARFWSKVRVGSPTQCWPWLASTSDGYGAFYVEGQGMVNAHRVAFFLANGRWPSTQGCHTCDNPPCCNPNHIFEGNNDDNHADMMAKGRNGWGAADGARHPQAKLTTADAAEIRRLYAAGGISQHVLAARFGVTQSAISKVIRRINH